MNNNNSSKQVLLSIVGIAILVIAVVGVSFAFFTYSKTGENQLLTTGTIFFQFTDGDSIKLVNQFPLPDEEGAGLKSADHSDDGDSFKAVEGSVMTFQVVGHDSSGKGIDYEIKAVPGDAPGQETIKGVNDGQPFTRTPLNDDEVKIYLKQVSSENYGTTQKKANIIYGDGTTNGEGAKTYKKVSELSDNSALKSGVLLGTGHITSTSKTAQQTDKYELRMWISDDVIVEDQEDLHKHYTTAEFAKKYYSIKIKIDAYTPE